MRTVSLSITSLILCLAATLATTPALAKHHGGGMHGPGQGHHSTMMGKNLGLDATQQTALDKLHKEHRDATAALKLKKALKKAEMRVLWLQPKLSRKALLAKQKEIHAVKGKLMEAKLDFKIKVMGMLKPAQKLQFLESMKHHDKMGRGHKKMGGHHGRQGHGKRSHPF